jgi:hypothetical protein
MARTPQAGASTKCFSFLTWRQNFILAWQNCLYFGVIVIATVVGGCSIAGTAVASIPNSMSADARASAAADRFGSTLGFAKSTAHPITTPVGCNTVTAFVPGIISISHSASRSGAVSTRMNHSLSGVTGEVVMVPRWFLNAFNFSESSFCCFCESPLGAIRASIFTLASRSSSAFWFASAARAFASAIAARADSASFCKVANSWRAVAASASKTAALSCALPAASFARAASPWVLAISIAVRSLNASQWCSLITPIHTISAVEINTINVPIISPILARSNHHVAQSNEGQISFSPWFPISIITAMVIIGISGLNAGAVALPRQRNRVAFAP